MLGGPGSGKTTLTKRLCRSFALGPDTARERYPAVPWCFPVLLAASAHDAATEKNGEQPLDATLRAHLDVLGGKALVRAFEKRWQNGDVLVLLDGLDEVANAGRRIACARAAGQLVSGRTGNRVLVTSRPVGYSVARLSVPCAHAVLEPFSEKDIETFAGQWYVAYDKAVRPKNPNAAAAKNAAAALMHDIRDNPRVASLASNPLMLTIIALIKQQNVTLPERRVELYEIALNTLIRSWNKARSLSNRPVGKNLSAEDTKKVWAAVAHWMHAEKSTGTVHKQQLQQKVVDVLLNFKKVDELEAENLAESYIDDAAETAGLLEERGTNVFAFMHQTFQEYLAARHLWLQRPRNGAIERVLAVTGDPRWHEVVRLAAGYVGVIQEDDDTVTNLVQAILGQGKDDPLEPWLCTSLRLAASCVADDVRLDPDLAAEVVVRICEGASALPYWKGQAGLTEHLEAMRMYRPEGRAVEALQGATKSSYWRLRMEATRMLARTWEGTSIVETLQALLQDDNHTVRAHAALGLWRSGERTNKLASIIRDGVITPEARFPIFAGLGLESTFVQLLEDENAWSHDRIRTAEVLCQWGHEADATPALLKLMEDESAAVRMSTAVVLSEWGLEVGALPTLLKLLKAETARDRMSVAEVLGQWGPSDDATSTLLELLKDEHEFVRYRAAQVLGQWDRSANAIAALLELLEDEDTDVRCLAAKVSGQWGHQAEATPVLLGLLEDEDADARIEAAKVLGQWGHEADATAALCELLEGGGDPYVRSDAAMLIGRWGPSTDATDAILKLLDDEDIDARRDAAKVLGQWGWSLDTSAALLKLLEDEDADVRCDAAEALGRWDLGSSVDATDAFLKLLEDEDADVRIEAAKVLGQWGHEADATPALLKFLEDEYATVRLRAVEALSQWDSSADGLLKFLEDKDADVRRRAAWELGQRRHDTNARRMIVNDLVDDGGIVEYLGQNCPGKPDATIARVLARAVTPQKDDAIGVRERRRVLYNWLWEASGGQDLL